MRLDCTCGWIAHAVSWHEHMFSLNEFVTSMVITVLLFSVVSPPQTCLTLATQLGCTRHATGPSFCSAVVVLYAKYLPWSMLPRVRAIAAHQTPPPLYSPCAWRTEGIRVRRVACQWSRIRHSASSGQVCAPLGGMHCCTSHGSPSHG